MIHTRRILSAALSSTLILAGTGSYAGTYATRDSDDAVHIARAELRDYLPVELSYSTSEVNQKYSDAIASVVRSAAGAVNARLMWSSDTNTQDGIRHELMLSVKRGELSRLNDKLSEALRDQVNTLNGPWAAKMLSTEPLTKQADSLTDKSIAKTKAALTEAEKFKRDKKKIAQLESEAKELRRQAAALRVQVAAINSEAASLRVEAKDVLASTGFQVVARKQSQDLNLKISMNGISAEVPVYAWAVFDPGHAETLCKAFASPIEIAGMLVRSGELTGSQEAVLAQVSPETEMKIELQTNQGTVSEASRFVDLSGMAKDGNCSVADPDVVVVEVRKPKEQPKQEVWLDGGAAGVKIVKDDEGQVIKKQVQTSAVPSNDTLIITLKSGDVKKFPINEYVEISRVGSIAFQTLLVERPDFYNEVTHYPDAMGKRQGEKPFVSAWSSYERVSIYKVSWSRVAKVEVQSGASLPKPLKVKFGADDAY